MAPEEIRELRRVLRYRNYIVRTAVKEKNKISGLLMEVGAEYNKRRLHGKKYSDYIGFWGGVRYPPNEADAKRLCSQLS